MGTNWKDDGSRLKNSDLFTVVQWPLQHVLLIESKIALLSILGLYELPNTPPPSPHESFLLPVCSPPPLRNRPTTPLAVEPSPGYSAPYRIPEGDTNKTTIYY